MSQPTYQDCRELLTWAKTELIKDGRITSEVENAINQVLDLCNVIEEETKEKTPEQVALMFDMEYREKINAAFDNLHQISNDAGITLEKK